MAGVGKLNHAEYQSDLMVNSVKNIFRPIAQPIRQLEEPALSFVHHLRGNVHA